MAGSNGIPKFLRVNRENQVVDFKTIGRTFFYFTGTSTTTNLTISADAAMQDLSITNTGVAGTVTWPAEALVLQNLSALGLKSSVSNQMGNGWTVRVFNTTNQIQTLAFPGYTVSPNLDLTVDIGDVRVLNFLIDSIGEIHVF